MALWSARCSRAEKLFSHWRSVFWDVLPAEDIRDPVTGEIIVSAMKKSTKSKQKRWWRPVSIESRSGRC